MFSSLALAAALSFTPAQTPALALTSARLTYGEYGSTRPDARFLPGDLFYVAFEMENLSMSPEGKVQYIMSMEVADAKNKNLFTSDPPERIEVLPLGGNRLPARAFWGVPQDLAAGMYTCTVKVTDPANKATQKLVQKFEVLPPDFGIVGLYTSVSLPERKGEMPAPTTAIAGQSININFHVVGISRDQNKRPQTSVEVRIMENGRPTLPKPIVMDVPPGLPATDTFCDFQVPLPLNREGNFTMEIKAIDKLKNKTSTQSLAIKVLPNR